MAWDSEEPSVITPRLRAPDLPGTHAYTLSPGHPTPGPPNFLRPPIASMTGAGILTRFPSATAFALTLGADSPSADERGGGNLGLSASEPFTRFIATHVSIRTSDTSSSLYKPPSQAYGTLSYHVASDSNFLLLCRALFVPVSRPVKGRFGLGRAARLTWLRHVSLVHATTRTRSLIQMPHP